MSDIACFVKKDSPYVIAEAADAHYGSLERAFKMIDAAKLAGADAIKFQHHLPDEEMLPDTPMSSNMQEPLYDFLKRNALSIQQHKRLADYCRSLGITYLCTPFSLKAAKELEEVISPIAFKIGSGELLDHPTIEQIMKFNKPLVISTGMATISEIDETYRLCENHSPGLVLMNCTSAYPPVYAELNLGFIPIMEERYPKALIGHSDHTDGLHSSIAAVALGAKVIEKHVTIDKQLEGPDAKVSIDFEELGKLVFQLREVSSALGTEKNVNKNEMEIRKWAHRSLVYTRTLNSGEVLEDSDVWSKRPGTGIPARRRSEFVGKTLQRNVSANSLLQQEDFN